MTVYPGVITNICILGRGNACEVDVFTGIDDVPEGAAYDRVRKEYRSAASSVSNEEPMH
jgi:hypothetical protein